MCISSSRVAHKGARPGCAVADVPDSSQTRPRFASSCVGRGDLEYRGAADTMMGSGDMHQRTQAGSAPTAVAGADIPRTLNRPSPGTSIAFLIVMRSEFIIIQGTNAKTRWDAAPNQISGDMPLPRRILLRVADAPDLVRATLQLLSPQQTSLTIPPSQPFFSSPIRPSQLRRIIRTHSFSRPWLQIQFSQPATSQPFSAGSVFGLSSRHLAPLIHTSLAPRLPIASSSTPSVELFHHFLLQHSL